MCRICRTAVLSQNRNARGTTPVVCEL